MSKIIIFQDINKKNLKDEYNNAVTRLEQIRDYSQATISQANLIAVLKDIAKIQLVILKFIARNVVN